MKFIGKQSGVSMIELIISLGVTAAIVAGVSTFMVNSSDQEARVAFLAARDSLYSKAIKYVSNRSYIDAKARSTNNRFFDCWNRENRTCNRTSPQRKGTDLSFLYGQNARSTLIRTPSNPAIYNRWGVNCGTKSRVRKSKNCTKGRHIWEVSTEYWFACQGKQTSCTIPVSANFKVYVRKTPHLKTIQAGVLLETLR